MEGQKKQFLNIPDILCATVSPCLSAEAALDQFPSLFTKPVMSLNTSL